MSDLRQEILDARRETQGVDSRNRMTSYFRKCVFCFFIFCTSLVSANLPLGLFNEANLRYKEKNYAEAIALYDSVIALQYASAELYYNLGNAHFKLGHLAPAILNYERAKKLSPGDADIEFNLRLANLRVVDRIEPLPELTLVKWFKNFIGNRSSDSWAYAAVAFIWLTLALGAVFIFANALLLKRLSFFAGLLTLLLSFMLAAVAYHQYSRERVSREAILFAKNAYVKSAPDHQSADLFILREGVKVLLLETDEDWQKIQLADGKVGWVKKETLAAI